MTGPGAMIDLVDPDTGEIVGRSEITGPSGIEAAVRTARAAQPDWEALDVRERAERVRRLADLVERDGAELAALDSREAGRPISEVTGGDLPSSVEALRYFAGAADKIGTAVFSAGPAHLGYEVVRAAGVGAAVLPWNFPLAMAVWKAGPALAAGNALLLKPADQTPSSALRLAGLAVEAGLPPGVLQVVTGDASTGAALVTHPGVDAVSFTGSEAAGRSVLAACAGSNLARVSLEMGGKSPHLVLPDAVELGDRLIDGLVEAAFLASGQNCTAGSRVLVHADVAGTVLARLVERAASLVVGRPSDPATEIGPLISAAALARVEGLVDRAVGNGARIETGGTRAGGPGFHYRPTVLTGVHEDDEIEQTEVFGPVVTVSVFTDLDDAVRRANHTRYGLAAGVWTTDLGTAHRVARRLRAGTVSVNCYSEGDIATPFGGHGASGFGGKEKSTAAFEQWIIRSSVWTDLAG